MSSGLLVALELILVLGGVVGFGVWEIVKLRRERKRDDIADADQKR